MVRRAGLRIQPLAREILPPIDLGIVGGALAVLTGPSAPLAIAALIGALALTVVLRTLRRARDVWILPALGLAGGLVFLAPIAFVSELLAGALGLVLLSWIALGPFGSTPFTDRGRGLLLPGVALALALSATLVLPGGPALVGVASGLLAAILIALAYLSGLPDADPARREAS
jgi:hypothetical protein